MIIEIPTTKQVNVQYIKLSVPVRYEDEDMPYDFPLRNGDFGRPQSTLITTKSKIGRKENQAHLV